MQVLGKWLSYSCHRRKGSGRRLLPPPAARSWAEALPASTAPAERLLFGAPCKQATNSALPGSAGGGILLLQRQYTGCRVSWERPGVGRAGMERARAPGVERGFPPG